MMNKVLILAGLVTFLASNINANAISPVSNPLVRHATGESCDPDECVVEGHCLDYWWCEREESDHKGKGKKGHWKNDVCDNEAGEHNLYWNPDHNDGAGACDFWQNLSEEVKLRYNRDPACIDPHCEWKRDPENECSHKYWYFHPEKNDGKDLALECPQRPDGEHLIWDHARKNCHPCHTVKDSNGNACC
jgi:hypothetical protein